ncbi:MAG: transcription elongation factor Spt5 [Candidatus Woesearchaeota archaeon]
METEEKQESKKEDTQKKSDSSQPKIYGLRTTANREDQVMDFVGSNAEKKGYKVYSIIRTHGMRGYIFLEAASKQDAEQAAFNIPYARGILSKEIAYEEIEHMLEMVKVEMNIMKNDIVEIISGPFKREHAKVTRIDKVKEEVVVELLEAAVPIPITVKMDSVKVIRRETEEGDEEPEEESVAIPSPKAKGSPVKFADEEVEELKMPGTEKEIDIDDIEDEEKEEESGLPLGLKIKVKKSKKKEEKSEEETEEEAVEKVKKAVEKAEEKPKKKEPSPETKKMMKEAEEEAEEKIEEELKEEEKSE